MIPRRSYIGTNVKVSWHSVDCDWPKFTVLWHDEIYILLRGLRIKHGSDYAEHDGIPFLVKWNAVKSIKPLK